MDGFDYKAARSPEEAVALKAANPGAAFVAGGTDLLPNLKHRILHPPLLIGLGAALPRGWEIREGRIWIGAGTRLAALSRMKEVPPLARAAGLVASPQIRNMGTLGGNILLDTRCVYFNQSEAWRKSLGWCLKAVGDWCHVINGPKTCVATQSSDTVPVLLAMGAALRLLGPGGPRELDLRSLYRFDGKDHLQIEPDELLTHVLLPLRGPRFRGGYEKLRLRGSIDFPMAGVAVVGDFEGQGEAAVPSSLDIVVGAVNPAPKPLRGLGPFLGQPMDDAAVTAIATMVRKQTRPQGSVTGPGDDAKDWRRQMAGTMAARLLRSLRDAPAPLAG